MQKTIGMILLAGATSSALAHSVDGNVVTSLSHQFFGAHHLLLPVVFIAVIIYLSRRWKRRDRV